MEAAMRVFLKRGYTKTNVSELVNQAGVARGTFYLYFRSKRDVMARLIDRFMSQVVQSASKAGPAHYLPHESLHSYFRKASSDLIAAFTQNRRLAQIILMQANLLDRDSQAKIQLYFDQIFKIVKSSIDAGIRQGLFRNLDTEVAARCAIGSVKEWLLAWLQAGEEFELEGRIVSIIDYLLAGLLPQFHDASMVNDAREDADATLHHVHASRGPQIQ